MGMPVRTWGLGVALVFAACAFGCSGTDTNLTSPADAGPDATADASDAGGGEAATEAGPTGHPAAQLASAAIDFGTADCGGSPPGQKTLAIKNTGDGDLTWSAKLSTANFFFLIGPTDGTLLPGQSTFVTISANAVIRATTPGAVQDSVLTVTTNDPAHATTDVAVKVTAAGGTLTATPAIAAFGLVALGAQATDIPIVLKNTGNKEVTVDLSAPADAQFAMVWTGAPTGARIAPGATLVGLRARFKPNVLTASASTSTINTVGALCGSSPASIPLSGQGSSGVFAMQPSAIDFGLVDCGKTSTLPAAQRTVTITNSGNLDFKISAATLGRGASSPYTVTLPGNLTIAKNGGTADIVVNPKAIPSTSAITDNLYGDTLTITTDILGDTPHPVTITESARGAILAYQPSTAVAFNNVPINASSNATFNVVNTGNAPATVGAAASNGPVFALTNATLGTLVGGDTAVETASFSPAVTGLQRSNVTLTVAAGEVLCAPLPVLAMSGTGTNGAIVISASNVDFAQVNCSTRAAAKSFTVRNAGNSAFSWNATVTTNSYALALTNQTLQPAGSPGDTGTVTVTPIMIPSVSDVTPDLYADTLTLSTTGLVGDVDHLIPIHMTARGAIVTASTTDLSFGGVRINTAASSQFSVSNSGNVAAAVSIGNANSVFTFAPQGSSIAANGGGVITGSFRPTATTSYTDTARFSVANGTPTCGPLPSPISLSGTGTNGVAVVAPTNLDFQRVNCGSQAQPQSISIQNTGGAAYNWTAALTVGGSYYSLSSAGGLLLAGDTFNLVVTPAAIPSSSLTTADLYAGQVTITTDVANDSPHVVSLHESANGGRLTVSVTTLAFGSVPVGSTRSLPFRITNSGNATVNIAYAGYQNPPFTASPDLVPILGGFNLNVSMDFQPNVAGPVNGQSLSITTSDNLCLPLPPAITLTGSGT